MSSLITRYQYGGYSSGLSANDISNLAIKDSSNIESLRKRAGWIIGLQLATMVQLRMQHKEQMRALGEINDSLNRINDTISKGFDSLENAIYRLENNLILELSDIKWILSSIDEKMDRLLNFIEFPRATEADELIIQGTITYSKGYFQESEICFQRAEKLNPTSFNLKINKGFLYLSLDQAEKAIENFKKAVDFSDFFYNKKNVKENDYKKSKIYAMECLARSFYSVGDYEKAYKEMSEAISLRRSINYIDKKALYFTQVYNVLSGGNETAIHELINLAKSDHSIYTQSILDPDLVTLRSELIKKYDNLIQNKSFEINEKLASVKQKFESVKSEISQQYVNEIEKKLKRIEKIIAVGKFDLIDKTSENILDISTLLDELRRKVFTYKRIVKVKQQKQNELSGYKSLKGPFDFEKSAYVNSTISQLENELKNLESELNDLKGYISDTSETAEISSGNLNQKHVSLEEKVKVDSLAQDNIDKHFVKSSNINSTLKKNVKSNKGINFKIFIGIFILISTIIFLVIILNGIASKDEPSNKFVEETQIEKNSLISNNEVESLVSKYIYSLKMKDISTLLSLYSNEVDYFGAGKVNKEFINKDKVGYYKSWDRVDYWLIENSLSISDLPNNSSSTVFRTGYSVYSTNRGKSSDGIAENTFKIRQGKNGLEIYDEKQIGYQVNPISPVIILKHQQDYLLRMI